MSYDFLDWMYWGQFVVAGGFVAVVVWVVLALFRPKGGR